MSDTDKNIFLEKLTQKYGPEMAVDVIDILELLCRRAAKPGACCAIGFDVPFGRIVHFEPANNQQK